MKIKYDYIKDISSKVVSEDNFLKKVNRSIYLREKEIIVLDKYNIDYKSCLSLDDLIYKIEERLNEDYNEDLDVISYELSERNYYQNTRK